MQTPLGRARGAFALAVGIGQVGSRQWRKFLGKTALDLKANDLIWDFFRKHPML